MLTKQLSVTEILDVGIQLETLAVRRYARLAAQVSVRALRRRFELLGDDSSGHRLTLRAHRRGLFGRPASTVTRAQVETFLKLDPEPLDCDTESLVRRICGAILAEENGTCFYERHRERVTDLHARRFLRVLVSEGRHHVNMLLKQIALVRLLEATAQPPAPAPLRRRAAPKPSAVSAAAGCVEQRVTR